MNTLFNLLMLLLVLSVQLLSFPPVEARKLNSNGAIFTIDLIHRDSLLSPEERQKRVSLDSSLNEQNDMETDITPSGGDYLMKLSIGSPPFEFTAVADTGSDLIWLQCSGCQPCIQQQSSFFDPTKSSTFQIIDSNSSSCSYSDLHSNYNPEGTGSCNYAAGYGDGTNSIGVLGTETLTFPSSQTLTSSVFGCGLAQGGTVSNGEGIIGLGAGPLSLVSQLGPNINHKFSYCLVPRTSGASSKLRFGADVTGQDVVSTPFVIKDPPDYYYLTLDGISIGSKLVSVGQDIVIDSGSTLTSLQPSVYSMVREAMSNAIGLSSVSGPFGMDLCYQTGQSFNPPDVIFNFKGADVVLKANNVFWEMEGGSCMAIVPTSTPQSVSIFGNRAQVNFEVGYDLQTRMVSFAQADCTTY